MLTLLGGNDVGYDCRVIVPSATDTTDGMQNPL